jgi:hypothetical protein
LYNRDVILDFTQGQDKIVLSDIDANTNIAGDQAFVFRASYSFSGVAGQLRYTTTNYADPALNRTIIEGDVDGDKRGDFQFELSGLISLSVVDFIL